MGKVGQSENETQRLRTKSSRSDSRGPLRSVVWTRARMPSAACWMGWRKITRIIPKDKRIPTTTHLGEINRGGIAQLANGTYWRIAHNDLSRARTWRTGVEVSLAPSDPGKMWGFKLTNIENGQQVAVTR